MSLPPPNTAAMTTITLTEEEAALILEAMDYTAERMSGGGDALPEEEALCDSISKKIRGEA